MSAAAMVPCGACGEQTPAGKRFCIHCGTAREASCAACGEPLLAGARFCAECGTPVVGAGRSTLGGAPPGGAAPLAERRLVSVLFVDLVAFTSLSEHRDPEEVRELLSRYFDRCRTLIERYGGTVEKFIGDAVMAVWGTPVAREDDAERAVRAGLALIQAIGALGEEAGIGTLQARAGILTGNAAVEVGAEGEGMVLGDTVNTASRLQSIAAPGTVLVDDVTRRASEAAIVYEDAGSHEVKGRDAAVRAWTALRVVAGTGGARRTAGLEAPLVGRNRELQAIIDEADASAAEHRARHVSVVGEAGSGKSRVVWEFFKYIDGIEAVRYWHQGRCLSYGEGVAYWSLAEMVRSRARILEEDDPAAARQKLREVVEQFVSDDRERRLVEPRLAHLLRLEERPDADRADLFSGWRLFLERLSEDAPVALVFEDLQWADSGLLDFIDYLLEWSAGYPIFVLTLARPELRERRPAWEPLSLAPLDPDQIETILEALAPGLPPDVVIEIGRRAEGIPLYAVETIRMLQDRGVLVQEGNRYVVTREVSDLDVPETLQALVASRLDGLSTGERSLLQDASVLGQSFTSGAAAALSGRPEPEVHDVLDALVAKQVLGRDDDPRSPDRGQYVFLQALLRTVAYGTLSRRARKARHVAAARHLEQTWPGEARDIAEVLASHYLEAIRAEPEADDVADLRASAREKLATAGQAAASLALGPEADRYFEQAAELADDELERAALFEQAGRALRQSSDAAAAERRLRAAIELNERNGRPSGGPASVTLSDVLLTTGRLTEAAQLLERFLAAEEPEMGTVLRSEAIAALGRVRLFAGELDQAGALLEQALTTLELHQAWAGLANALVSRGGFLITEHRREEGAGVLARALSLADQHGFTETALRARFNLAAVLLEADRLTDAVDAVDEGLAVARERGDRWWEQQLLAQRLPPLVKLGRWDEAVSAGAPLTTAQNVDAAHSAAFLAAVAVARGDELLLEQCLTAAEFARDVTYVDQRVAAGVALSTAALAGGEVDQALELAESTLTEKVTAPELIEEAYELSLRAAAALGDTEAMARLVAFVDALPAARTSILLRAGRGRLAAEQAHRRGDEQAAAQLEDEAIALLREAGARPALAQTLIERGRRHRDPHALSEARDICTDLGAVTWLAQVDQMSEFVV